MKKELINHLTWLVNQIGVANEIEDCPKHKLDQIEDALDKFYGSLKLESNRDIIDFKNLTVQEARELRFGKWSNEDEEWRGESKLYLFPSWIYPLIPEGLLVTTINGGTSPFRKSRHQNDSREGCLPYGLLLD